MKKIYISMTLFMLMAFDGHAQGVIFYQNDGTQVKVPFAKLDSLVTYTADEEEEKDDENVYEVKGIKFRMIPVEGGTFTMGADATPSSSSSPQHIISSPPHQVTLSSYMIAETEVTQELWYAIMGYTPVEGTKDQWLETYGIGPLLPAYRLFHSDVKTFINKLNTLTGQNFRLPTEAEWEFAAKGGNLSKGYIYSGSNNCEDVGWISTNSGRTFHPVKQKQPNELGIYDMSGNAMELCEDWIGDYSTTPQTNPKGPSYGESHAARGGDFGNSASCATNINRDCDQLRFRVVNLGFRLAKNP